MRKERNIGRLREELSIPNPLDNTFVFDERQKWDVLSYMTEYMKFVKFYNAQNEVEGNWATILLKDPIFYKSNIITASLQGLERDIFEYNAEKISVKKTIILINSIEKWYKKVGVWVDDLTRLRELKLADKIDGIQAGIMYKHLKKIRQLRNTLEQEEALLINPIGEHDLEQAIATYQKIITYIQELTKENLKEAFFSKANHLPNNALYLSFVTLFEHIQKKVNTFPKRHLAFYYAKVLHQSPKEGEPIKAIVNFDLKDGVTKSIIDSKIQLSAGKQFNLENDLVFGINKPIHAYSAKLTDLFSVYLKRNTYLKVGTQKPIISDVLRTKIISNSTEEINLSNKKMPLFGADPNQINHSSIIPKSLGTIGFVISSPVLFLAEGKREVIFNFVLEEQSAESTFWKLLREIADKQKTSLKEIFSEVFKEAFELEFTTDEEWKKILSYRLELNREENSFSIHVLLNLEDPPISKLLTERLRWPAFKFLLNPYAPIFAYSFLQNLRIATIRVKTNVSEIRNLSVYNELGQVDLNSNFDLFGPWPKLGTQVNIGKSEIFKKNITRLNLNVNWANLPKEEGGFEAYYDRYPNEVKNENYRVNFAVLNKGKWLPKENEISQEESLFETKKETSPEGYQIEVLKTSSTLEFKKFREVALAKKNYGLEDPLEYTIDSLEGFIQLTFTGPEEGFGDEVYPDLVSKVSMHNAQKKRSVPPPNKPFVPTVSRLEMSYEAEDSLSFSDTKSNFESTSHNISEYYHISPIGWTPVIRNQEVLGDKLIYDFGSEGQLYMRIENVNEAKNLSVYFDLDDTLSVRDLPKNNVFVHYLNDNQWFLLDDRLIINDGTMSFRKAGIIEMSMPKLKNNSNAIWLKVSTQKEALKYPYLKGIYFNAIEAHCLENDPMIKGNLIGAAEITNIIGSYPDIQRVSQPNSSFGGEIRETERAYYKRVANRLRHKDRAITHWDYEQLIFDHFEKVEVVKCTNKNKMFEPEPNQIRIAVLSKLWNEKDYHLFSHDELLKMQIMLAKRSNSFAKITVINPIFEYLLVNCSLVLKDTEQVGFYISQINTEINRFLSPINQVKKRFGGIGGMFSPMILMSYLEKLPFIKSGKYLSIEHIIEKGEDRFLLDIYQGNAFIETTNPCGLLIPMEEHNIDVIGADISEGIGHFQIGKDLIIEKSKELRILEGPKTESKHLQQEKINRRKEVSDFGDNELLIVKLNKTKNAGEQ